MSVLESFGFLFLLQNVQKHLQLCLSKIDGFTIVLTTVQKSAGFPFIEKPYNSFEILRVKKYTFCDSIEYC